MLTQSEFEGRFMAVHGDRYDLSSAVCKGWKVKVAVTCVGHGQFWSTPSNLLKGKGCPKCAKRYRPTTAEFIERARSVHGDSYDYSKVSYRTMHHHIVIVCRRHGEFEMYPRVHLRGCGCPMCVPDALSDRFRMRTDKFIKKAVAKHGSRFNYSKVSYGKNQNESVTIICRKHGEFLQKPNKHLGGQGCPRCKATRGELAVYSALESLGIEFEAEKRFSDCRDKNPLPFDVWVPSRRTLIEFDGPQHSRGGSFWVVDGDNCQRRDTIKNEYAARNGYRLVRIPWSKRKDVERLIREEMETSPQHSL